MCCVHRPGRSPLALLQPCLGCVHPSVPTVWPQVVLKSLDLRNKLLGREAEVAQLTGALAARRLVVITGGAGMGKSRLAQEVVAELCGLVMLSQWQLVDLSESRAQACAGPGGGTDGRRG